MPQYKSKDQRLQTIGIEGFTETDTVLTIIGNTNIVDDQKIQFGDTTSLELYYDTTSGNSFIDSLTSNSLVIRGAQIDLGSIAGDTYGSFVENGAVSLYYDNLVKFATTTTGVTVTGTIVADGLDVGDNEKLRLGDSQDLEIYHDGTHSYVTDVGTGNLYIGADQNILLTNPTANEFYASFNNNGSVELYYDNTKRLETSPTGATTTGIHVADGFQAGDGEEVELGDAQDLKLYHDGTNSYVENATGDLYIRALTGEESIVTVPNAEVAAYYDNVRKVETTPTGIEVFGIVEADNITEHKVLNDISSLFNGVTTQFTISTGSPAVNFVNAEIPSEARLLISVGGIVQEPDPGQIKGYYISGGTNASTDPIKINFVEAPKANQTFFGVAFGLSFEPPNAFVTKEQAISYSIVFGGI